MEFLVEKIFAIIIAILGPILTIFDFPGNTLILITSLGFTFFDENLYFSGRLVSAMVLIYALGECWEFCVELFGIKKQNVSWAAVFLIGIGGFAGTLVGTMFIPVIGSIIGGMIGAFLTAFIYELLRTGLQKDAFNLAVKAAKIRFLAIIGKLAAGIALSALLLKQIVFM